MSVITGQGIFVGFDKERDYSEYRKIQIQPNRSRRTYMGSVGSCNKIIYTYKISTPRFPHVGYGLKLPASKSISSRPHHKEAKKSVVRNLGP